MFHFVQQDIEIHCYCLVTYCHTERSEASLRKTMFLADEIYPTHSRTYPDTGGSNSISGLPSGVCTVKIAPNGRCSIGVASTPLPIIAARCS